MADHIASYGLTVGSFVAPIWAGAGGGSAIGSREERDRFVSQVRKAAAIGRQMRELGIRPTGGIRINSSASVSDWDKDPAGNTRLIAETFREAGKAAEDHGEFLVAKGEICWGGMHSWREKVNLLEKAAYREWLAFRTTWRTRFCTRWAQCAGGSPRPRRLRLGSLSTRRGATKVTAALRPWTLIFMSRRTTAPSSVPAPTKDRPPLQVDDPDGKLDIAEHAGFWIRGDNGELTAMRHICWDGCMFPNEIMTAQQTWNDVLGAMIAVRDAHGWQE